MRPALIFALTLIAASVSSQDIPTGYFAGGLYHNGAVQAMSVELSESADGPAARVTVPDFEILQQPVDVAFENDSLQFGFLYGRFSLGFDAVRQDLRGWVALRDGSTRLAHFSRATRPAYSETRETDVVFQSNNEQMAGSLILPDQPGRHPVVVFVQGRSYGDRWGNYSWALRLAQHGIGALIFDGRGSGGSEGSRDEATAEDRYADAVGAVSMLLERQDVDADQIGLWGISAGGWVVPEAALRSGHVAFLILDVAPSGSLAQQQGEVVSYNMRRRSNGNDFTEEDYAAAYQYQKTLVELSWQDAEWSAFEPLVADARAAKWAGFVDLPDDLENSELDYFRRRKGFDVTGPLAATTIPVLAFYGERDFIVPDEENAPRLAALLREAGNVDFTIRVVLEGDHGMTIPEREMPDGSYRWPRIAPGLGDMILGWLLDRVHTTR